jgi:hypothetical protein
MMKTVPTKALSLKFIHYPLCLMLCMSACPVSFSAALPVTRHNSPRFQILVSKTQNNKKHRMRLYSNDREDQILFSVNGPEGNTYQLYLFDMDGHMVTQANAGSRETRVLNGIERGNYLFEVFTHDEQVESGQLTIK